MSTFMTVTEVQQIIDTLNLIRAPGVDGVLAEMLKHASGAVVQVPLRESHILFNCPAVARQQRSLALSTFKVNKLARGSKTTQTVLTAYLVGDWSPKMVLRPGKEDGHYRPGSWRSMNNEGITKFKNDKNTEENQKWFYSSNKSPSGASPLDTFLMEECPGPDFTEWRGFL